ncbi:MAG: GAF domain-containing protein [Elusimicrobiota bacterium]|nr:GAF domain-containing protein [Elusimicrobiota bacterium]
MTLGLSHYQLLSEILEKVHYIYDEEELSGVILEALSKSLDTEAGTIFRISESRRIVPTAAYGASLDLLKALGFSVGDGVVGWVAQYAQPVKVDDPQSDHRFTGMADAATGFTTRNILSAPILAKGKAIGALEFINKRGGPFTIPDLELLSMIGRELGIAFENVRLLKELRENHAYLKSIVGGLGAGLLVLDHEQNVVVLNQRAKEILDSQLEATLENRPSAAQVAGNAPEFLKLILELARGGRPVPRGRLKALFGLSEIVVGYSAVPVTGESGRPSGMTFLFQDITPYEKEAAE